jgi:hypothetical protein
MRHVRPTARYVPVNNMIWNKYTLT